jgi:hypothetical protein
MNKTTISAILALVAFGATTASSVVNGQPVDWAAAITTVVAAVGAFHLGHAAGSASAAPAAPAAPPAASAPAAAGK